MMIRPLRDVPKWWLPTLASSVAGVLASTLFVVVFLFGPTPPEGVTTRSQQRSDRGDTIRLAGTGTWLPLAKRLVQVYQAEEPTRSQLGAARLIVHDSIGSGGGRRAIEDGAIDIGLVSLRPDRELSMSCCRVIEIAVGAVVFAVDESLPIEELTEEEVLEIFNGRRNTWSNGVPIVPLLRERGDSAVRVASRVIPGFSDAIERARGLGHWPMLLTDGAMGQALDTTPGAIGLYDLGAIGIEQLGVRALALDGVTASPATLADGTYPLRRVLAIVVPREPRPEVSAFVEFLDSSRGRAVIEETRAYQLIMGDAQ